MHPLLILATVAVLVLQFTLSKKWAFVPLLVAACHLGNVEVVGNFTAVRLVIMAGMVKAMMSGGINFSLRNPLDQLFLIFSMLAILSSVGHPDTDHNPWVERVGLVINILGSYLYARSFVANADQFHRFIHALALVLIPLSFFLAVERATGKNSYFIFGARGDTAITRNGQYRAQGPFNHAILAGTVGATAFPLFLYYRKREKKLATIGMAAALMIVMGSGSSGPLVALMAACVLLVFWRWREHTKRLKLAVLMGLVVAHFAMARPVWFLIARIDLVGGSTGWHRSKLIDAAINNLDEWWLWGTDYTRHWMHTGVSWSPNHTDLTNYYIHLGVLCGLPLLICFIIILRTSFRMLGSAMSYAQDTQEEESEEVAGTAASHEFLLWCVGTVLVAHAVSFISISYFGQMYALLYSLLGAIPGLVEFDAAEIDEEEESASVDGMVPV